VDLHFIWFVLLGVLLTGYATLDGFDLGVGILHFVARDDRERRIFLRAIGPIWDGNEVWLVTFGGALFAAFPEAYATIFSAYYLLVMCLLGALIFRAAAIEFRGTLDSPIWRRGWDIGFSAASALASFLFGVSVGNAMLGIPLDAQGNSVGSTADLFGVYPALIGALTVAMFAVHGALYLQLKIADAALRARVATTAWRCWGMFLVLYQLATLYTLVTVPHAVPDFQRWPAAAALVVLNVLAIAAVPRALYLDRPVQAFVASGAVIATLVALFGAALWPNLVRAANGAQLSLTVHSAASTPPTLHRMLIIAAIGVPLFLTYSAMVYWVFRRRVGDADLQYAFGTPRASATSELAQSR